MDIRRAATPADFALGRAILGEQREWLEALIGDDLVTVQPAAELEYGSPQTVYRSPHGSLILAVEGHEAIGVVGIKALGDGRAELKRTYVRPGHRGKGAGAALVRAALDAATELGFDRIVLDTDPIAMTRAYDLYRRLGFRDIPALDAWDVDTATGMELDLSAERAAA